MTRQILQRVFKRSLSLFVLATFSRPRHNMTFSTAINLQFDGLTREVDFVAWRGEERIGRERQSPPQLVVGEAKSFGEGELIKRVDLDKLKSVALKLPNSAIVISVLRDKFTPKETVLLRQFVKWSRRDSVRDAPINPVVLLTASELTAGYSISRSWRGLGGRHAVFTDIKHFQTLERFAEATRQIYLDLPPFHQTRDEYWKKRHARRKLKAKSEAADC